MQTQIFENPSLNVNLRKTRRRFYNLLRLRKPLSWMRMDGKVEPNILDVLADLVEFRNVFGDP
jgi:hypothetical protein